jgi:hypothetical protein
VSVVDDLMAADRRFAGNLWWVVPALAGHGVCGCVVPEVGVEPTLGVSPKGF